MVERFRVFVTAHENCFERSCASGHITGSAWLLDSRQERALLTHHRKLDRWLQLGGHSDGDPDSLAVALREAREESGLAVRPLDDSIFDLDVHLIPARGDEPAHYHFDVRFALCADDARFRVSDESHALRWIPIGEVDRLADDESVVRMARKWRAHGPSDEETE